MRRWIVSVAVSRFAGSALVDLPFAESAREALLTAAKRCGYQVIESVAQPSAAELADLVAQARSGLAGGDVLIVHVLSHGRIHGGTVQVFGADARANSGTSLDTWLLDATGDDEHEDPLRRALPTTAGADGRRGPWLLFLVDVCAAGQAARMQWAINVADERRRAWVIAGCLPDRPGFNGRFTRSAAAVLNDLGRLDIHPSFRHVPLDRLAQAIREESAALAAAEDGYGQTVVATRVDIASRVSWPPFFDNPSYRRTVAGAVPGDLREFAVAVEDLFDAWHFMSRAAGRPSGTDQPLTGGSFRGKGAQLRALSSWLAAGATDTNVCVVTGAPGVGKSALLGMLVCAAHPLLAEDTRALWWARRDELPPVIADLAAVHAHEQDTGTVLGQAAAQLALPDPGRAWTVPMFVTAVRERSSPAVLVIDALDEAVDAFELAVALRALAEATREDAACRLLVGSRSGPHWPAVAALLDYAVAAGSVIDLDDEPRDALRADLRGYVDDLLRNHHVYRLRDQVPVRAALAAGIAERLSQPEVDDGQPRWGEFLVAGLFVNHLSRLPPPSDLPQAVALAHSVPRTLPEVLDLDLSAASHPWLYPALVTIAHSFGAGLPRRAITACAPIFAGPDAGPVTESDIADVLDLARFYLRRDVDSDATTVYRLFHQALTDHLREHPGQLGGGRPLDVPAAHSGVVDQLLAPLRDRAMGTPTLMPYAARHAIDHAAVAERVDELLADTRYVVQADPVTLGRHLHHARSSDGQAVADVYRTSYLHHRRLSADPAARHSLLLLDAVRHGQTRLARRFVTDQDGGGSPIEWRPAWSTASAIAPALRHTLIGHTGPVSAVVCTRLIDGTEVAVTIGDDATARVWNLADGSLRTTLVGHAGVVLALSCLRLPGGDCAVTTGADRQVHIWDLAGGRLMHRLTGHEAAACAVACAELRDGNQVAVTADRAGIVRVWRVGDGTALGVLGKHPSPVTGLDCTRLADGSDVVVTGSADGTARVWDLGTGTCRHVLAGHRRAIRAVVCVRLPNGSQGAITASVDGTAIVWDLAAGAVRHTLVGHTGTVHAIAMMSMVDRVLAVTASSDGTAGVWDLTDGRLRGRFTAHTDIIQTVDTAVLDNGDPIAVTGSMDGTARVWRLHDGQTRHTLTGHDDTVTAVACTRLRNRDIAVTASADGTARVWEIAEPDRRYLSGHTGTVYAVVCASMGNHGPVGVSGSTDGTARVWSLHDGQLRAVLAGHADTVVEVAAGCLADGVPVVITASTDGSCRVWDPDAGRLRLRLGGQPAFGTHVPMLAWTRLADGTDVAITTSPDPAIRIWNLADGTLLRTLTGYLDWRSPIACARLVDRTDIVIARTRDGRAKVWNLGDGTRRDLPQVSGEPLATRVWHRGPDTFLTATVDGESFVTLLHRDGVLRTSLGTTTLESVVACTRLSDGQAVAVTAGPGQVPRLWRLADGGLHTSLGGHTGPVTVAMCVPLPDGDVLALAAGRTLRLWTLTGQPQTQPLSFPEPVNVLTAGPDGSIVVAFGTEVCRLVRTHRQGGT